MNDNQSLGRNHVNHVPIDYDSLWQAEPGGRQEHLCGLSWWVWQKMQLGRQSVKKPGQWYFSRSITNSTTQKRTTNTNVLNASLCKYRNLKLKLIKCLKYGFRRIKLKIKKHWTNKMPHNRAWIKLLKALFLSLPLSECLDLPLNSLAMLR